MGRKHDKVVEQGMQAKEMYENGYTVKEIAKLFGVSKESIYNSFTIIGLCLKKPTIDENNLVYADNSIPEFEKVVIDGKTYIDVTPIFAPR